MTACREWKDRLLDAALGEPAEAKLDAHLAACPACSAALADWRAHGERLDAAVNQLVRAAEPSPAFRARVLAAAESVPAAGAAQPAWLGALAAVAVVLLAGLMLDQPASAPRRVTRLSDWRSPTDWLLETPGDELLRSAPRVGDFYFSLEPEKDSSKGGNNEG